MINVKRKVYKKILSWLLHTHDALCLLNDRNNSHHVGFYLNDDNFTEMTGTDPVLLEKFLNTSQSLLINLINFTVLGDPRTNQNPPLLAFGILFYQWHNVIANRVQKQNPDMSDEEVFQRARRVVVGTLQVSEYYESY